MTMAESLAEVELRRQRGSDRESITAWETTVCWKLFTIFFFSSLLAVP